MNRDASKPARAVQQGPDITTLHQLLDRLDKAATGERVDVRMHDGGRGTILVRRAVAAGWTGDTVAARHHPGHSNPHRAGRPDSVRATARGATALLAAGVGAQAIDHDERFRQALGWLQKPARFADRLVRPRLSSLTTDAAVKMIAVGCIVVALAMPVMEVVPFSANLAGIALTAFGLAVIAHDGLLALVAFAATAAGVAVIASQLL